MTGQPNRLPAGGRIDRERTLRFLFDGRRLEGHPGDTLASALLANGVRIVGRSFKYHRPRGVFGLGAEEPNALVQLGLGPRTEPNIRATQIELYDGLIASSQNAWPSAERDLGAVAGLFAPLIPAGFYYKTFMGPAKAWRFYERWIRRAAGMGHAPDEPDPDRYERAHAHCDVLVVGAGPTGLAAALSAARTGARVILANEQVEPGGSLLGCSAEIAGKPALAWVATALAELGARPEVRVLRRATVEGAYDHNLFGIVERLTDGSPEAGRPRQRVWQVRARQMVLATGAIERPLAFSGNDRPGVMLASAVAAYALRYGAAAGRRILVFTNNDWAYRAALDLAEAGCEVVGVVDLRAEGGSLAAQAETRGMRCIRQHAVVAVEGRRGVQAARVAPVTVAGDDVAGPSERIACDAIAVSGGWNPAVHLFSQARGKLLYDAGLAAFVPGAPAASVRVAGGANGKLDLDRCLAEGWEAGRAAAADTGFETDASPPPAAVRIPHAPLKPIWRVPAPGPARRWVDFQNDVTDADIALAHRENYASVEHLKRYTTLGMGTDQGKTSNVIGIHILAEIEGREPQRVGTTTFRPPYTPVTFGAIVGRRVGEFGHPIRRTPMHHWHERAGAPFVPNGLWLRPQAYPKPGEALADAINREAATVRSTVGLVDVSTLGKIDIQGRDAVEFLNRVYVNGWSTLAVGKGRYGVMLREDGFVFDDGVTTRLAERRFHMTTTTANAARVYQWLELHLQTRWRDLEVYLTPVTDDWAAAAIAGPKSRDVLASVADIDVSDPALPYMGVVEGRIAGIPARIFRISFSGELSFEVNVPADHGLTLWEALIEAGRTHGIAPYGLEALTTLRIEKGHVVGAEFDGRATPVDLGFERMVSRKKDFIGRWALGRPALTQPDRLQLVGLLAEDASAAIPPGAQIVPSGDGRTPQQSHGHVTSTCYSPTLGRHIALALVARGRSRHGETVMAVSPVTNAAVSASLREPGFVDPEGKRLHG